MNYLTEHNNLVYGSMNPENETCEEMGYEQGFSITERVNKAELKDCYIDKPSLINGYLDKILDNVGIKIIGGHKKQTYINIKFCFILVGESSTDIEHAYMLMEEKIDNAIYKLIK